MAAQQAPLSLGFSRQDNFYTEYIMRNTGLEEAQAGMKIAGRNINNLRYADDTTLTAENEEELKSLLMKVKEETENVGLCLAPGWPQLRPGLPFGPRSQASLSITNS